MHRKHQIPHQAKPAHLKDVRQREFAVAQHQHISHSGFSSKSKISHTMQIKALICLSLIGGAYAIEAAKNVKEQKDLQTKKNLINRVCKDTRFENYNKPNITLGAGSDGFEMPVSCLLERESMACQTDFRVIQNFQTNYEGFMLFKKSYAESLAKWEPNFIKELTNIFEALPYREKILIQEFIEFIVKLNDCYLNEAEFQKGGIGDCFRQSKRALIHLFREKIKNQMNLKLQEVTVSRQLPYMVNHHYLLLDSNVEDTTIANDQASVETYLSKIVGTICDPWNHGHLADFAADQTHFYDKSLGWDSIIVKTLNFDFEKLNSLSSNAREFIIKEMERMKVWPKICDENSIISEIESHTLQL